MGNAPFDEGTVIGRYRLGPALARGGIGTVHLARDSDNGARVALKAPRDDSPARIASLRREAHVLRGLCHPRVIRLLDAAPRAARPWFTMPYVEGQTVQELTRPERKSVSAAAVVQTRPETYSGDGLLPFAPSEPVGATLGHTARRAWSTRDEGFVALAVQLLGALSYLERLGVAHGDVAPSNMMVHDQGLVLIDFGLAARSGEAQAAAPTGYTYPYSAPERIFGKPPQPAGDVYAAGCVLYELFVGRRPFCGAKDSVLAQHVGCTPVPPDAFVSDMPYVLQELLVRMLEKRPEARPSAREAERTLIALSRAHGTPPTHSRLAPRTDRSEPQMGDT